MASTVEKISSSMLSVLAGVAAFVLTLLGFLLLGELDQQVAASFLIGLFALCIVHLAAERPNAGQARAVSALIERLLAVRRGDLSSPAPEKLRQEMPALASAVDGLFEQVRSTLDDVHAMALYDPVTSLPNRIHFRREAEQALREFRGGRVAALLFIDLDGFKEVNDWLGHAQGDQVLAMVAKRLRAVIQGEAEASDVSAPLIARLAGDEFTILLPSVRGEEEAEQIAGAVLGTLSEPFRLNGRTSYLGASIGIALAPEHGQDLTALMKAADIAMYSAKETGRSRACVYTPALAEACAERARNDEALRAAVARGELELVYEPQLCLRTGAIVAAEALIRWNPADGEARLLSDLATFGDERGLALEIGDWALNEAARALERWDEAGLPQRLSINLGRHQLQRGDGFERLRGTLLAKRADRVEIELDERLVTEADSRLLAGLEGLRRAGIGLSVAKFGSGGAPVSRVAGLRADRIKLDPALLAGIDTSARSRTVVTSLIHLIHGLECEAVARGVERQEQIEVLRAVGCDLVQGFIGGQAMDGATFIRWALAQDCANSLARAS